METVSGWDDVQIVTATRHRRDMTLLGCVVAAVGLVVGYSVRGAVPADQPAMHRMVAGCVTPAEIMVRPAASLALRFDLEATARAGGES